MSTCCWHPRLLSIGNTAASGPTRFVDGCGCTGKYISFCSRDDVAGPCKVASPLSTSTGVYTQNSIPSGQRRSVNEVLESLPSCHYPDWHAICHLVYRWWLRTQTSTDFGSLNMLSTIDRSYVNVISRQMSSGLCFGETGVGQGYVREATILDSRPEG